MKFRTIHYIIPVMAVLFGILAQYSGLDVWLAGHFYDQQHKSWPYQNTWLTQDVIHIGGRNLLGLLAMGNLLYFVMSLFVSRWRQWRRAAGYLLAASLTSLLIISQLKSHTHIYSPWDLKIFGGPYAHIRLFDTIAQDSPVGYAFPSGHASGGYILLSVYFLLYQTTHRYRHHALALALLMGLIFGVDQQIRGAHMLSHDLFTLAICWSSCMVWARLLFNNRLPSKVAATN